MTNREFIQEIVNYYIDSRRLSVDIGAYNIWRGVSHSISSKAEDLFAKLVAEELKMKDLEFVVDKTMSFKMPGENSIQFRPDLAIIKDGTLTHVFDLKMDMGYKRRYHETEKFKDEEKKFQIFRTQSFERVWFNTGYRQARELSVSNKIINQIVVISEKNEGKEDNRTDMINSIEELDWANIYYLTGKVHPNNYSENTMDEILVNEEEFKRLFLDTKTNF